MTIRPETPADVNGTRTVHMRAFGRPAESVLVDRLRADGVVAASLVAEDNGDLVGHRFGFSAGLARKLRSPYAGPSLMAVELSADSLEKIDGEVRYPAAFDGL